MAPVSTRSDVRPKNGSGLRSGDSPVVTAFVCANCARPGSKPDSGGRPRPTVPQFDWPFPVKEILVACTGRIQPEHVLKAFESGSDLVVTVACAEENCHFLEGSKRCARRVDYLHAVLDEVGLGSERLMLFHLPGTAAEDMALGCGGNEAACSAEIQDPHIVAIRDAVASALSGLAPNPLHTGPAAEEAEDAYQEVDDSDEDNED